ncbi:MAG: nucleotidyltransferase family protein [Sphingomonadaceae bacterium]
MNATGGSQGHFWPNPAQRAALLAALADDGSAPRHFMQWLELSDPDAPMDEGTERIVPLMLHNLARHGCDHPRLHALKSLRRQSWAKSEMLILLAEEVLVKLRRAGIPTLVSKGLPLALEYYPEPALRPMNDIDVIVPYDAAVAASRLLQDEGFRPVTGDVESMRPIRHALMMIHPRRGEIDLHWHVLGECHSRGADEHFWAAALPFAVGGAQTSRPGASDLLLHAMAHGLDWNPVPPMRWIADAAMILRAGEEIDWRRIEGFGARHDLARRLSLATGYLRRHFGLDIPAEALSRESGRVSLLERLELSAMSGENLPALRTMLRRAAALWRLLRSEEAAELPAGLVREWRRRRRGGDGLGP